MGEASAGIFAGSKYSEIIIQNLPFFGVNRFGPSDTWIPFPPRNYK